ncbi:MAG TPA: HypC/HybG/HupF family hydrogenase formation chaperone [Solirubrobacteraceae bacterium]|nr:HypC/HybG/HupF family hydrogenase formation chaperone [Solirubrobacteraceae bacterium]
MRVIRVDRVQCLAVCITQGSDPWGREEVAIDLVEPVVRGQTLLVHAGVALANLDQTDAALASLSPREEPSGRRGLNSGAAPSKRAVAPPPERLT